MTQARRARKIPVLWFLWFYGRIRIKPTDCNRLEIANYKAYVNESSNRISRNLGKLFKFLPVSKQKQVLSHLRKKNCVQLLVTISNYCACVEICNHPFSLFKQDKMNIIPLEPRRTGALCCIASQHLGFYVRRVGMACVSTRTRTAPEILPGTAGSL